MEEIVGWLVEKIDVSARKIPRSFTKRIVVQNKKNSTFTGKWMYLHWFLYGDKCKNINVRDIINVQVHLLFLAAGLFEDKAREKGLLNISTFFSNPLLCLKQDDFQITHIDERKGTKDYMKISLV